MQMYTKFSFNNCDNNFSGNKDKEVKLEFQPYL